MSAAVLLGASLDTALCRNARQRLPPSTTSPKPELVELPCGARLRLQQSEPAGVSASDALFVMAPDPPNTLEVHADLQRALASRGIRLLTFELPGFGFSRPPPGFAFSEAALAGVVEDLLRWLQAQSRAASFVLCLSCVAGLAARRVAAASPCVVGLVSLQTPSRSQERAWACRCDTLGVLRTPLAGQMAMRAGGHRMVVDSWYRIALAGGRGDPLRAPLEQAAQSARQAGAHNCLASAFQALVAGDQRDDCEPLSCPALVIWGTADRSHGATVKTSSLDGMPPGTRLVELPAAGHFPELEATEAFVTEVASFIRALDHATTASRL